MRVLLFAGLAALLVTGCEETKRGGGGFPGRNNASDASASDASPSDTGGGASDSGPGVDLGPGVDVGFVDAGGGPTDTGPGPGDTGPGPSDTGAHADAMVGGSDSGPSDSGGGTVDAGPRPDAGFQDTLCVSDFGANEACGGSLVGNWTFVSGCLGNNALAPVIAICPTASRANQTHVTSGTMEFTAAGRYTRSVRDVISADITVPPLCQFPGQPCSAVAASIQSLLPSSSSVCNPDAQMNCVCRTTIDRTITDEGNYTAAPGSVVFITEPLSGGTSRQEHWYCATGNVLKFRGEVVQTTDNGVSYVLTR